MFESLIAMPEFFLFVLALVFSLFVAIQDLKSTEVSNWVSFSLLAFALTYRLFYSVIDANWMFFVYGVIGAGFFFLVAYLLYLTRGFGGGDAKLLIAFGAVLPFESFFSVLLEGLFFIFVLLFIGSLYGLIWGSVLACKNWKIFGKDFSERFSEGYWVLLGLVIFSLFFLNIFLDFVGVLLVSGLVLIGWFLFVFVKSIEKVMIIKKNPKDLQEGDWLLKGVKVGDKKIGKSVHGLSMEDIKLLRKAKKKVFVKTGVPFVPVFVLALIMVFALEALGFSLSFLL